MACLISSLQCKLYTQRRNFETTWAKQHVSLLLQIFTFLFSSHEVNCNSLYRKNFLPATFVKFAWLRITSSQHFTKCKNIFKLLSIKTIDKLNNRRKLLKMLEKSVLLIKTDHRLMFTLVHKCITFSIFITGLYLY